ncbi:TIGD6 (predicted) [Pycnogonum litorale]
MAPERKQISLFQKAEIVQKYRSGVKQSKLAEDYGLAKTTINTIVSKGDKILAEYEGNRLKENRKRMRTAAHPELESALFQWFEQVRSKNVPVTGPLLIEKAKEFANRLKIENFRVSTGWLAGWIVSKTVTTSLLRLWPGNANRCHQKRRTTGRKTSCQI